MKDIEIYIKILYHLQNRYIQYETMIPREMRINTHAMVISAINNILREPLSRSATNFLHQEIDRIMKKEFELHKRDRRMRSFINGSSSEDEDW